jgi:N utilization substance protein B
MTQTPNPANDPWLQGEDAFPEDGSLTGHPRTEARLGAVQALFSARESGADAREAAVDLLPAVKKRKADASLFADITTEAAEGADRYKAMIAAHASDEWPIDRMDPVHFAILWAAVAELTCAPETPAKVVISEYLNIAKGFAAKSGETGFINAVLDKMAGKIRG